MIRVLALACVICAGAGHAAAQTDPTEAARAAVDRLEAAQVALAGAGGAREQIAALTEIVRAYEDGLAAMRDALRRIAIERQRLEAARDIRSTEIGRLLGVLQMLDPQTAPLLLLHPSGALGTARAGMILADVTPALQAEVESLRAQLQEITDLQTVQDRAIETLRQGLDGVQEARAQLAEAVSNRTDLPLRFTEDATGTALLLASTETLDAFAGGLGQTIGIELAAIDADPGSRRGTLVLPVQGQVLRGFNQPDAGGIVRPGVILATRPRALVTAPLAATIRFRGPLLDYGTVVILEPGPDLLIVLAGLAETLGEVGQVIPEGTPIGLMGGETPNIDVILSETGQGGGAARSETLYLEVREGQTPVDPAEWFALE
ncbi:MAG: peptidoglycan DD-metalloendopeptidase family protein [Rubellimicrobium sp.]|nr:peptidoglycan DD-metalloendopeptidase family protein [Rubellimicrobium sp.]